MRQKVFKKVPLRVTRLELETAFAILVQANCNMNINAMRLVKKAALLDQNLQIAIEYLLLAMQSIDPKKKGGIG
jgi:hypothetical protein